MAITDSLTYKILRELKRFFWGPYANLIRRLRDITREHFGDKRLGIATAGQVSFDDHITIFKDGILYLPTPYGIIEKMLAYLALGPEDVFVDFGCGKGRVVFSVAARRLKKVIGVEVRKDIAEIARQNLKNLKSANSPVEIVNADAATFDIREGTVFFMYQPFGRETLAKVASNIKDSLTANPRKIRIVYYGSRGLDGHEVLKKCDWLAYQGSVPGTGMMWVWQNK